MKIKHIILISTAVLILATIGFRTIKIKYAEKNFQKVEVEEIIPKDWEKNEILNENYVDFVSNKNIIYSTVGLDGAQEKYYSKYIDYIAPNSKPIRILAQDKITDEQLLYVYSILEFYLKSTETLDKTEVANSMANNNTIIIMPNGSDREGALGSLMIGQPQFQNETANPGSNWYMENDYSHRDSTFEEVFHTVHQYGIGFVKHEQADQTMAKLIYDAKNNALPSNMLKWGKEGLWRASKFMFLQWYFEKGSMEAEYIISVIDAYYGLWGAYDGDGAIFGEYVPKVRSDVLTLDPKGAKALEYFLPEYITVMMRVDPDFSGEFKMSFDEKELYTHKSQYYLNMTLTGSNNNDLTGNSEDNILIGNSGNNIIDGVSGYDIVQFHGNLNEYRISQTENGMLFEDTIADRDGTVTIINIDLVRFRDIDIAFEDIELT